MPTEHAPGSLARLGTVRDEETERGVLVTLAQAGGWVEGVDIAVAVDGKNVTTDRLLAIGAATGHLEIDRLVYRGDGLYRLTAAGVEAAYGAVGLVPVAITEGGHHA